MRGRRSAVLTTLLGATAVWVAAPLVSLARHGSVDDRTRAAWLTVGTPATVTALGPIGLPAPRRALDDLAVAVDAG